MTSNNNSIYKSSKCSNACIRVYCISKIDGFEHKFLLRCIKASQAFRNIFVEWFWKFDDAVVRCGQDLVLHGEYSPRECRRFRFWFIVASYISRRRCLRLFNCVGWHARRRVQLDRGDTYLLVERGGKRKAEHDGPMSKMREWERRSQDTEEERLKQPAKRSNEHAYPCAIHISWNTSLLRRTHFI